MLKELLKQKYNALSALVKAAIDAGRAMTEEEQKSYDALEAEIASLEKTIAAQDKVDAQEKAAKEPVTPIIHAEPRNADEKKWKSFGEFLTAVKNAAAPGGSVDNRLYTKAPSGLGQAVPSDGGFLVDTDFVTSLFARVYDAAVVAQRAFKVPISAGSNGIKVNTIDESSRVDGSRYGGVRAYWESEADTTTATKPKFRQMGLELKKLMALCYTTDEMLQDTAALESIISRIFTDEMSFKVDDALINGTGAGMPLGILNAACLVSVAKEAGQAADTILFENVLKMWSRMWAKSRSNAVWYINQDVEPQLYSMSLSVGTGGVPVYMPASGISGTPYGTLFGRPVIPIEQCATVGDVGDIILADMSQYMMIDKGGLQAASSVHVRFLYDESVFRFIYRCDGQPMWNSALTPFKGSNTQSPFVALAARA